MSKSVKILLVVLFVVMISRFFILGKGYLAFPDEYRHIASQDAVEAIRKGDFSGAVAKMFEVQGRPGLVISGRG